MTLIASIVIICLTVLETYSFLSTEVVEQVFYAQCFELFGVIFRKKTYNFLSMHYFLKYPWQYKRRIFSQNLYKIEKKEDFESIFRGQSPVMRLFKFTNSGEYIKFLYSSTWIPRPPISAWTFISTSLLIVCLVDVSIFYRIFCTISGFVPCFSILSLTKMGFICPDL